MGKLDEEGVGGWQARGSEGGSYRVKQFGVVLGFAVLLAVVVAQAVWSQHQWDEMQKRIQALEKGGPAVPDDNDDDETTTFIILESKDRSERRARSPDTRLRQCLTPSDCLDNGKRPSAHLVPVCSQRKGRYPIVTSVLTNFSGIPIIQNFWAEDNTCARASNSHMTGGMYLINGGILMVPCQGLYHVYAQIRLRDASTPNDNPITITLTKVCLNASTSHPAVILEKYVMPSSYGGYPSLAGTFNMSCGCGFALSTMLFSQVRVSANGPSSFLGAFLVDAATPDHKGSRR